MDSYNITQALFHNPPIKYRPWTRWWLPGGDIQLEELIREVNLFADTTFGGAEIQPFVAGINPKTLNDHSHPIYDYDSPEYYEKIVAVLEEAEKRGLQIDLTLGSGWPAGGTFVPLEDNVDTLVYGEMTINRAVDTPVPPPIMPFPYAIFSSDSNLPLLRGREWTQTLSYHPEKAQLITVLAAKITKNKRSPNPAIMTDTMHLDIETVVDISDHITDGHIQWTPPSDGDWQIISIYTMPSGSHLLISAIHKENYVTDPFDTDAIIRFYDNWIGKHPELLAHAGKTLRALFSDSYEYFAQRLFSDDFIETFRQNRGYDITPFLPAVFQPAHDQHFFFFVGLPTAPDFSFGKVSQRIIYDYNLTVSDLFFKHWYPASRNWIEDNNMQFRQQGYNPPLDVIKAGGAASIPETEGGNPLWLKRVASGGHLYGRPIISAETFVFLPKGGFALTPQDYKQGIDLLMTSGVNQVIYHGTPYKWEESGYGEIGWSPFISPYGSNISTTISEADPFWKYQNAINQYVSRLQVLLQQGKPSADTLIYLPIFDDPDDKKYTGIVTTMNASGYAWEWINDDLISQAEWTDLGLKVGDMVFQCIALQNVTALPVSTATKLAELAQAGLPIVIFGTEPSQHTGYLNYLENDKLVVEAMSTLLSQEQTAQVYSSDELIGFIQNLPAGAIHYAKNFDCCYIRRQLDDDTYLAFIRNMSDADTDISIEVQSHLPHVYWLESTTGQIYANEDPKNIKAWLPAYGSIAILCSAKPQFSDDDLSTGNPVQQPNIMREIPMDSWHLKITGDDVPDGEYETTQNALFDWGQHDQLKYVSSVGVYNATCTLDELSPDYSYILDLGTLHSAGDVTINGKSAGHVIFAPYQLDITQYLTTGDNTIQIEVTPPLRNRLLGKALAGDPEYAQFIGRPPFGHNNPAPAGLVGPVSVKIIT